MTGRRLDRIQIEGYKSIASGDISLRGLNVLVGPNGTGKSNFVSVFGLLGSIVNGDLQVTVGRAGGASTLLHGGSKRTSELKIHTYFGSNQYEVVLVPDSRDDLIFSSEMCYFHRIPHVEPYEVALERGGRESHLRESVAANPGKVTSYCLEAIQSWKVYHFHDTSAQAAVKQKQPLGDNLALRSNASNLAPFLYRLRESSPDHYARIVDSVRLVAPFLDDFQLTPDRINSDRIQLEWHQIGSDEYFNAHSFSDGTLRFICLSTLLLQPEPPSVIVIDEPELGLHPFAITQLAGMFRSTSIEHQLILSTQSVTLLNQLDPEDIIVTELHDGETTFVRPNVQELQDWLKEYAIGDLWEKNVIGGRPY